MPVRFNAYTKTTYDFLKEILVHCPRCSCKAYVASPGSLRRAEEDLETKITCSHCGYSRMLNEKPKDVMTFSHGKKMAVRYFYMNAPIDPFFHLPLWLQKEFKEGVLWAYNYEHLRFLEDHVTAGLRERRSEDTANHSIGSRLPRWMTAAKNREEVAKGIKNLQEK